MNILITNKRVKLLATAVHGNNIILSHVVEFSSGSNVLVFEMENGDSIHIKYNEVDLVNGAAKPPITSMVATIEEKLENL